MGTTLHSATLAAFTALSLLAGASALAGTSEAQARYDSERATCMQGLSNQDQSTCLKEAGAALQETRLGRLPGTDEGQLEQNRLARCGAQSGADRDDCVKRMQAGSVTGSAPSGGILRTLADPDPR